LKVENPDDYEKDTWAMSEEERTDRIPALKDEGNALYKEKKYFEAAEKYGEALGLLEQKVMK
jgi:AH receptor-interacting protein